MEYVFCFCQMYYFNKLTLCCVLYNSAFCFPRISSFPFPSSSQTEIALVSRVPHEFQDNMTPYPFPGLRCEEMYQDSFIPFVTIFNHKHTWSAWANVNVKRDTFALLGKKFFHFLRKNFRKHHCNWAGL